MDEQTRQALRRDRTIDITTTGARSGRPRRIETWRYRVGDRIYLSGRPGRRDWYANLVAHPEFTYHLKGTAQADLPARAHPVTDPQRRREVLGELLAGLGRAGDLERWLEASPLVEVELLDG